MHDILISTTVCLVCLVVALVSQVIAPSVVTAKSTSKFPSVEFAAGSTARNHFELDPDEPNPSLFTMASDSSPSDSGDISAAAPLSSQKQDVTAPYVTTSGLKITDLVIGDGIEARKGRMVKVHYRGTLEDGTQFDTSYGRRPFSFPLGAGQVISGWDEGVAGMKVGGKRQLVIPPELGYGNRGAGSVIPPNATLTFEVELLGVSN
ncbi:FKBP-type peptidyl-prolyl cis-trans isomerase [cyanobiont of Ornithocercus magnificus]|nr:FKBP-type peptidyl-prolyl cis-trans isomerase [cyanobiont of Ornithocercus magnificus]